MRGRWSALRSGLRFGQVFQTWNFFRGDATYYVPILPHCAITGERDITSTSLRHSSDLGEEGENIRGAAARQSPIRRRDLFPEAWLGRAHRWRIEPSHPMEAAW